MLWSRVRDRSIAAPPTAGERQTPPPDAQSPDFPNPIQQDRLVRQNKSPHLPSIAPIVCSSHPIPRPCSSLDPLAASSFASGCGARNVPSPPADRRLTTQQGSHRHCRRHQHSITVAIITASIAIVSAPPLPIMTNGAYYRAQAAEQSAVPVPSSTLATSILQSHPTSEAWHAVSTSGNLYHAPLSSTASRTSDVGSTGKGILIGMLSAFGSAAFVAIIFAIIYFFRYTSRGRIILDRIGRPGEFDDEQAFAREEAEALEEMDDLQRAEYQRAKGRS